MKKKNNKKKHILPQSVRYALQRVIKGYDSSLSWNLGYNSIKQMKIGLEQLINEGGQIVDFTFHKISYRGQVYSLLDLLKVFLNVTTYICDNYYEYMWSNDDEFQTKFINNLSAYMELYSILLFYLWW